jgi:hypothetical protein
VLNPETIEPPFQCQLTEVGDRQLWIPYLEVAFGGLSVVAHHFNSVVRTFPDAYADHVEVKSDDGLKGLRLDHDIIDKFIEYQFPRRFDPYLDDATLTWLEMIEGAKLDAELDGL